MRHIFQAVALAAVTCSLGACATITRGHDTAWEVKTTPPAARVETTNNMQCDSTPCSLKMARNAEFDATITKRGYKTLHVHVTHKIATAGGAGMAGNVLLGGIIGAGVDVATGAMYDLTPNPLDVALEKDDGVPTAAVAPAPTKAVGAEASATQIAASPSSNKP